MTSPSDRRFTVFDVMIMSAALAVGLGLGRQLFGPPQWAREWHKPSNTSDIWWFKKHLDKKHLGFEYPDHLLVDLFGWSIRLSLYLLPLAAPLTGAVPALWLRRHRHTPRAALRLPGIGACVGALVGLAWGIGVFTPVLLFDSLMETPFSRGGDWMWKYLVHALFPPAGAAVATTWVLMLVLRRRRRPGARDDALDRVGRWLGVYWLAAAIAWLIAAYVWY